VRNTFTSHSYTANNDDDCFHALQRVGQNNSETLGMKSMAHVSGICGGESPIFGFGRIETIRETRYRSVYHCRLAYVKGS
jgi:hypothetical protein